ncbi:MAG: biopolymer transporter ExbD [Planctomycetes bacterium]|nr:biopolymer transporter ExbD [Planctomycetota bacterium]
MRIASYPRSRGLRFNMTPMIDVVFLLIIFFLVASTMAKQDSREDQPLPEAASGHQRSDQKRPAVIVNVRQDGQIVVSGDTLRPRELAELLRQANQRAGGDLEVRINAHRRVSYDAVKPILLACVKADVWNFTFIVAPKRG